MDQDVELSAMTRTEYVHTDEHLLGALRRFKQLRTYPTASDRGQLALHERMVALERRGLVRQVGLDGAAVRWRSAL
jgi:hypothetical protein